MMRRTVWLAVGATVGATGALWSSRRLSELSERARSGEISGDLARLVRGGAGRFSRRVARAVDAGRDEARRRHDELRGELDARQ